MSAGHPASTDRLAGLCLMGAAGAALALANSPLAPAYHDFLHAHVGPLSVHLWVADALMAVFFLMVGLEVKREWYDGQLATSAARRLPIVAAVSGMAVPALVYLFITRGVPGLASGWAIPAATDIAFALGVLALIGGRAPAGIKLLLVTIAIIDDIGAVAIIALFYTADLNVTALAASAGIFAAMLAMSKAGVRHLAAYLVGFAALWLAVFQSGVHPTIAGVLAAFAVPLGIDEAYSPLKRLEHALHRPVMLGIVPLFGFVSAGVAIGRLDAVLAPLPLGIALGLFVGKQVGVFGAVWLADRVGLVRKPAQLGWPHIYAAALLCGIGFTMSLFIGALAFASPELVDAAKIGTLLGSAASVVAAFAVLRLAGAAADHPEDRGESEEVFGENFRQEPSLDPLPGRPARRRAEPPAR